MKPVEVLGVETDENDRVIKIMGSKPLLESVRSQFKGVRLVVRKPVMLELKLPDLPADAPKRLATSEKVTKSLREWKIADAGYGVESITGITNQGESISDYLLKPFKGTEHQVEGERAIYEFGE